MFGGSFGQLSLVGAGPRPMTEAQIRLGAGPSLGADGVGLPQERRAAPLDLRHLVRRGPVEVGSWGPLVGERPKLPFPVGAFPGPSSFPTPGGAGNVKAGVDASSQVWRGGRGGSPRRAGVTPRAPGTTARSSRSLLLLLHPLLLHAMPGVVVVVRRESVLARHGFVVVVVVVVVVVHFDVVAAVVVCKVVREKHSR